MTFFEKYTKVLKIFPTKMYSSFKLPVHIFVCLKFFSLLRELIYQAVLSSHGFPFRFPVVIACHCTWEVYIIFANLFYVNMHPRWIFSVISLSSLPMYLSTVGSLRDFILICSPGFCTAIIKFLCGFLNRKQETYILLGDSGGHTEWTLNIANQILYWLITGPDWEPVDINGSASNNINEFSIRPTINSCWSIH